MRVFKIKLCLFLLVITIFCMFSCRDKTTNPNINLNLSDFDKLDTSAYALNSHRIREYLDVIINADDDSMAADTHLKGYYTNKGAFLWIDRSGIDYRAALIILKIKSPNSRVDLSSSSFFNSTSNSPSSSRTLSQTSSLFFQSKPTLRALSCIL